MTFIAFFIIDNHPTFMNKVDLENDWWLVRFIGLYISAWSVVSIVYTNYSLSLFMATFIFPAQYCIRPTNNKFLAIFELIILIIMSPLFILMACSFLLQMDSVQLVVSLLNYFSNFFCLFISILMLELSTLQYYLHQNDLDIFNSHKKNIDFLYIKENSTL